MALLMTFILLFLLAAGCSFKSGDELYCLPQAPDDYLKLQAQLDEVIKNGAEYAAPQAGNNTQTVQMVDLNGDGVKEAVAFFRDTTSQQPLRIYIYQQKEEGYEIAAIIEGDGVAINSITYTQLTGDNWSEIIVCWQMSTKVQSMTVYDIKNFSVSQMMQESYTKFAVCDMDQDNREEIIVFHADKGDMGCHADYFDYDGKDLVQTDSVQLSNGIDEITNIKAGKLVNFIPALFVESQCAGGEIVTDIFACRNGRMENITRDSATGVSAHTVRYYSVFCTDINKDGIVEVPLPVKLPAYKPTGSDNYWMIHWVQYALNGTYTRALTTYHNYSDGWYLILPEKWVENITVSRSDSISGERSIVFSQRTGENSAPIPFLTISKLTGANREERSKLGNRFVLMRDADGTDAIYTGEFAANQANKTYMIGKEALLKQFHLISVDWNEG